MLDGSLLTALIATTKERQDGSDPSHIPRELFPIFWPALDLLGARLAGALGIRYS